MFESLKAVARPAYHRFRSSSLAWELRNANGQPPRLRRIARSTPRWAKAHRHTARVLDVHPPARVTFPSPRSPDQPAPAMVSERIPPGFVVRLNDAEIGGAVSDILTADGTFLADLAAWRLNLLYLERAWHPHLSRQGFTSEMELEGTVCALGSLWASSNYFHWLLNVLPRLLLIRASGIALETMDWFVVNPLQHSVQWESLLPFGIDAKRLVQADDSTRIFAKHVIATSSFIPAGHMTPWVLDTLRHLFLPPAAQNKTPHRRLFVSRNDAHYRHLTNEAELLELLNPLGFERVLLHGKTLVEQAELFAGAAVIVMTNGAATANFAFCAPGTRILALHHPSQDSAYSWQLAGAAGLDYSYVCGELLPLVPGQENLYHYTVSPDALRALVRFAGLQ